MSECYRPTLTFPGGAYNATQVRLYGIPGTSGLVYPKNPMALGEGAAADVTANMSVGKDEDDIAANTAVKARLGRLAAEGEYSNSEIIRNLADTDLDIALVNKVTVSTRNFPNIAVSAITTRGQLSKNNGPILSCGIIVGYSFEGHCYDLPKPKIMLIPVDPTPMPPDDCGYDRKNEGGGGYRYMVWIVDKLDECIEFEINQGFVEQLVLEANLPGKRSPAVYASKGQMGHRGGRLND